MTAVITFDREKSLGLKARKFRVLLGLTRQELADTARVSREEVDLFEHGLPVQLDVKHRLLEELSGSKASKCK